VFGAYPEAVLAPTRAEKTEILTEIASSYVLKDILAFDRVKSARALSDLLKLLALQIGHEVSLNEMATQTGIDVKTAQRYLDLLETSFVLFRVGGFSRNLRNEVTGKSKYYFFDTGIRNAVIAQFNGLDQRNDVGQLWENFVAIERLKHRSYAAIHANAYFWRTYTQQEIDLIEERDGRLFGFEAKWSPRQQLNPPKAWTAAYPDSEYAVVTPANYLDYVS